MFNQKTYHWENIPEDLLYECGFITNYHNRRQCNKENFKIKPYKEYGLDGLATGTSAIIGATLALFAYVSGNIIAADYLNIMYIPYTGELVIYMSAFVGACVGFMWYNSYPAQVFMGDTGSLTIGGIIAVIAIAVRKELLLPVLAGIFVIENLSVILQVSWFKYTRKKFGEGRRIFKMSPLHHHYQKLNYHESKIVVRFWIVGILLAVFSIVTLKLR